MKPRWRLWIDEVNFGLYDHIEGLFVIAEEKTLELTPREITIEREDDPEVGADLDDLNERLLRAVNATGEVFLSHTRLRDRFAIRVAIGSLHTEERDVERAWELLRREAAAIEA